LYLDRDQNWVGEKDRFEPDGAKKGIIKEGECMECGAICCALGQGGMGKKNVKCEAQTSQRPKRHR